MERGLLIEKLKAAQEQLQPGDAQVFDFEYVIAGLIYNEQVGYGHAPLDRKRAQAEYYLLGYELLGIEANELDEKDVK